jgi:DegV family protein with EDD domain
VRQLAFLETLHYAWKGGRVPKIAAWAGSLLQVKPLLELSHGEVSLRGRPRTRQKAIDRLLQLVAEDAKGAPLRINVLHAQAPEDALALQQRVERELHCTEVIVSEFAAVVGAHTGPGLLGLAYYPTEGEEPSDSDSM